MFLSFSLIFGQMFGEIFGQIVGQVFVPNFRRVFGHGFLSPTIQFTILLRHKIQRTTLPGHNDKYLLFTIRNPNQIYFRCSLILFANI